MVDLHGTMAVQRAELESIKQKRDALVGAGARG